MSQKDYRKAASIAQAVAQVTSDRSSTFHAVVNAFASLFRDEPCFDADCFRRACLPGANVNARPERRNARTS